MAIQMALSAGIPQKPLEKAKVILTRHTSISSSQMDADNLAISFKPIMDGLVEAGVLIDDNMDVIGQPEVRMEKAPPKKGFVTVEIIS